MKARNNYYRMALGSSGECDSLLEILEIKGCPVAEGRELLSRIGAMLYRIDETPTISDRAAAEYLHPDSFVIVVVGDTAQFDRPLSAFGKVNALSLEIEE